MKSKLFLILYCVIFATFAFAQAPRTLTYQGKLTDASGYGVRRTRFSVFSFLGKPRFLNSIVDWSRSKLKLVVQASVYQNRSILGDNSKPITTTH